MWLDEALRLAAGEGGDEELLVARVGLCGRGGGGRVAVGAEGPAGRARVPPAPRCRSTSVLGLVVYLNSFFIQIDN